MACPGLAACLAKRAQCGHAGRVFDYRDWRTSWELLREQRNPGMYAPELADYDAAEPAPTFRDYLLQTARRD